VFGFFDLLRRSSLNIRAALRYPLSPLHRKTYRLRHQSAYRLQLESRKYRRLALQPVPQCFSIHRHELPIASQSPIRVAAISHNLNIEGAPLAQMELLVALAQSGLIVPTIISPHDGPLRQEYESAGIAVKVLEPMNLAFVETFDESLLRVEGILADCRADVVYANTLVSFWAVVAAERMKLPALWNVREVPPAAAHFDHLPTGVREEAYKCFHHSYRVIFVSGATFNMSSQFESRDNFDVIYDAVDWHRMESSSGATDRRLARAELGLADSDLAIVSVGTIVEGKGQLDLVEAVTRMPEHAASQVKLFLVGDRGGDYSKLLQDANEAMPPNLASRIRIVATSPRSHIYFSAADIAVCCSRGDSYPRAVHEAMFFGLPLVTTLTCGCELVHENSNALVYSAGDVGTLASHLTKLVTDTALRQRLAANSLEIAKTRPTFDGMVRRYGDIFAEARSWKERVM
jgi:glycosyltransferase involved in cell wall biosynthesis